MKKTKEINQNTEEKIIEVATELFAKNGFEGTSTREICKLAEANISMISYYFGGKKELYEKIVTEIVVRILNYMKSNLGFDKMPESFANIPKKEKIKFLYRALDFIIDYFYSDKISGSEIMILFREQMTSGIPINAEGYKVLKRLLASILDKNENDKEIIFRTITIIGQVHSARIFKQFSLNMMNQSGYSKEDIQVLKQIIISQIKAILSDLDTREDNEK